MRLPVLVLFLGILTRSCLAADMKALKVENEQRHLIEDHEQVEVEQQPENTADSDHHSS
jgi:hypothetical protein